MRNITFEQLNKDLIGRNGQPQTLDGHAATYGLMLAEVADLGLASNSIDQKKKDAELLDRILNVGTNLEVSDAEIARLQEGCVIIGSTFIFKEMYRFLERAEVKMVDVADDAPDIPQHTKD